MYRSRSRKIIPINTYILLTLLVVLVICIPGDGGGGVYAFGAGNIPSFAYMEGRAFRHGDIEDTLSDIIKGGASAGAGFSLGTLVGKGPKFGGLDIKRVYFGNWLRDYSQAVDIAGLKKLQLQTIINLCMVLGFLAHGYATHEFEVTAERLGVYLPTEHIDNPKGYGEDEDARKYHPSLRGPVDPRELEVDMRTGMKNYIANEDGPWDTSKALVRRTLERCIHLGRQHRAQGRKEDLYEAYRLLGQLMHTLEDFPAHSNFCELTLVSMGYRDVFVHVGDHVRIQSPGGNMVAPIVTGTFGSSDFIHSLLGEATDHISQASVSDLNRELDKARSRSTSRSGPGGTNQNDPTTILRDLLFQIPGGGGGEMSREMDNIERIRAGPAAGGKNPDDMSPQELHSVLWQVLSFRDSVVKKIEKTIEKIPGLGPMIEKLMDSISVFVFTTLEPYLKPIMKTASSGLTAASGEVIDSHDQYEVFNDPMASDPTHSFLSKDHFNLILNEPAGMIAKAIVGHTARLVVRAWDDASMNVRQVTEDILQCLFHPDFHNPASQIQREMLQTMRSWVQGLGHRQHEILSRLTKAQVQTHKNIRAAGDGGKSSAEGTYAWNAAHNVQHEIGGYVDGVVSGIPGVGKVQGVFSAVQAFGAPPAGQGQQGGGWNGYSGYARDGQPGIGQGSTAPPLAPAMGGGSSMPVSSSGEAASYYLTSTSSTGTGMSSSMSVGGTVSSPAPPILGTGGAPPLPARKPGPSFPGARPNSPGVGVRPGSARPTSPYGASSYAPPSDGLSFPSIPGVLSDTASGNGRDGYAPSYSSPPPPPRPLSGGRMPGSPPTFPSALGGTRSDGGFGSGGGPSSYSYSSPAGPPPPSGPPGASSYGPPSGAGGIYFPSADSSAPGFSGGGGYGGQGRYGGQGGQGGYGSQGGQGGYGFDAPSSPPPTFPNAGAGGGYYGNNYNAPPGPPPPQNAPNAYGGYQQYQPPSGPPGSGW